MSSPAAAPAQSHGYELVIGLEVHAQLLTQSKCFCPSANNMHVEANQSIGPVSFGLPGSLPVLNHRALELAVRAGLALDCTINTNSYFARKNYFYPDLPKGYQISQYDQPLCSDGKLEVFTSRGPRTVHIERIHMEEDAGRLQHVGDATMVNLNRSGVPLIEIVTRPVIHSAEEAVLYLKNLHAILVFAGVTDGNLEEGNFRCDVNLSVRPVGTTSLGIRSELKNLNSFRFVEKAIEFEFARHVAVLQAGGKIRQETRGWDGATSKTFTMRVKEEASDYRYFPDPDLPPLRLRAEDIERIRSELPELPQHKRARFQKDFHLSEYDASVLVSDPEVAIYFEKSVELGVAPKLAANWTLSTVLGAWNTVGGALRDFPVTPQQLFGLLQLLEQGVISGKIAKDVFVAMQTEHKSAAQIVEERGLRQVDDSDALGKWCDDVISKNPDQVAQYRSGKEKVFAFFVGQVMKLSQGKANPEKVSAAIKARLSQGASS